MNTTKKWFLTVALGLLAIVALAPEAHAQSTTTGAIRGVVSDSGTGEGLAGVTVVATSPALQGTQAELTDGSGQYTLSNLPPGRYEVTFYYADITVKRSNVDVSIGRVTQANVKINTAQTGGETITIEERAPSIDVGSSKQGVVIDNNYTKNIPTGRTYESTLGAAAGSQGDALGVSFSGSTSVENSYVIDGINTTGLTYGTVGSPLLNNFIQEIEVITGGYEAEFGRSTGGVVNVVTKSGSNEFHGSVFSSITPFELQRERIRSAQNALTSESILDYSLDFGFDVGGPIVKDKVWFYVGFAPVLSSRTIIRKASTRVDRRINTNNYDQNPDPDSDPTTTTDLDCYVDQTCEADGVPDIDPETGFAVFEEVSRSRSTFSGRSYVYTAKINFAVTPDHQGAVSVLGSPGSSEGPFSIAGTPAATTFEASSNTIDGSVKWTSKFLDNKVQLDAVVGLHRASEDSGPLLSTNGLGQDTRTTPRTRVFLNQSNQLIDLGQIGRNPDAPEDYYVLQFCTDNTLGDPGVVDPFPTIQNCPQAGYSMNSVGFIGDTTEERRTAKLTATSRVKAAGHHEIKVGGDVEDNFLTDVRQLTGGKLYESFGDWEIFQYVSLTDRDGDGMLTENCSSGPGDDVPCDYLERLPATGNTTNFSAFVQDKWQILPNFTVTAGLRWEAQYLRFAEEIQNTVDPITGVEQGKNAMELTNLWAPRIGVLYDWTKEGRSKIYANFGRFYESIPMDINNRSFGGETTYESYWDWEASCGGPLQQGSVVILPSDPTNCPQSPNPAAGVFPDYGGTLFGGSTLVMPGTGPQYLDEFLFGLEYELLEDLNVGGSYQNRRLGRVIEDVSTDGAHTYIIANPGEFSTSAENELEADIMAETDPVKKAQLESQLDQYRKVRRFDEPVRDYNAFQLTARKRFSKQLFAQGSYTFSVLRGNYPGLFSPDNGQLDPNISSQYDLIELLANRDGPLPHDRPHSVKLDTYYIFDLKEAGNVTTGARLRAQSGSPIDALGRHSLYGRRESFLIPRGSFGRTAFVTSADLHLAYGRKLAKGIGMEVYFDIFNLFNTQTQSSVDEEYTIDRVNPIVGGTESDLMYLKQLDFLGHETPNLARRNINFAQTSGRLSPLAGRFGLTVTF